MKSTALEPWQIQLQEHVQRLQTGDERSFQFLYEEHVSSLYTFVLKFVKSPALADDIVQETFIRIWERREQIDHEKSFRGLLYKIAKNQMLNLFARAKVEDKVRKEITYSINHLINSTEESIHFKETENTLQRAIGKLPEQQKKIFELCKVRGLTYEQAAEELNLSPSTINAQMVNSLRFVKQYMLSKENIGVLLLALFNL